LSCFSETHRTNVVAWRHSMDGAHGSQQGPLTERCGKAKFTNAYWRAHGIANRFLEAFDQLGIVIFSFRQGRSVRLLEADGRRPVRPATLSLGAISARGLRCVLPHTVEADCGPRLRAVSLRYRKHVASETLIEAARWAPPSSRPHIVLKPSTIRCCTADRYTDRVN
jgi:hypothetical protein